MKIDADAGLANLGGKAFQLLRLREAFHIPPFFTLTFEEPNEIENPEVQAAIIQRCHASGFQRMAVRSSAPYEDSDAASYAGIFESVLNVELHRVIPAVRRVLASATSPRVAQYVEARGLRTTHSINVIIQEMVTSRVAGVCLTKTPERPDSVLIEACLGLGDALVSGNITPDSYWVNRTDLSIHTVRVGYQTKMLSPQPLGGELTSYEAVPFYKRNAKKLSDDEIILVAQTCLKIEQYLAFDAADLEWAFEREHLYVLQARPLVSFYPQGA